MNAVPGWYICILAFHFLVASADEAVSSQSCSQQVEGLKTDGRGSLMQVAQQTRHPGSGRYVAPFEDVQTWSEPTSNNVRSSAASMQVTQQMRHPGSGHPVAPLEDVKTSPGPTVQKMQNSTGAEQEEAMSYFSLGAGAPLDGGEFHQIPVFEEPSPAGNGGLVVLSVIFLTLVGSMFVIACFGAPMDSEDWQETWPDKALEPEARRATSPLAPLPVGRFKVPQSALQPSRLPRSQDLPERIPILAPVAEDAAPEQVRLAPEVQAAPLEAPTASAQAPAEAEGPPVPRPSEAAAGDTSWDPPDMEADGPLHLPPMGTAFPPWHGGMTPQSASVDEGPATVFEEEVGERLFQHSLSLPDLSDTRYIEAAGNPWFLPFSESPPPMTLCPGLVVPRQSECGLVIPIPTKDRSAIFVIVFGTDAQPLLRAEVYRGHNCAPPCGSPMTSVHWPPASASLPRSDQHASVVLTTLPPEMRRSGDVSAAEEPQILSTGYLVRGTDGMEMDIVDGDGRFFGRLGRDPDRHSRYCLRCGEHGETRIYCDGVYEDFALLLTDEMQEVLGEVEAFNPSNAPFSEAVGCICMKVNGSRDGVDAGLMLAIYFGVYELHWGLGC